jgi:predicted membrane protein DUF2142
MAPGRAVPLLVGAFLALVGLAWLVADPPGYGPDERAHYVKAVGVGGGDLYGKRQTVAPADLRKFFKAFHGRKGQAKLKSGSPEGRRAAEWQQRASRQFDVPAGLYFPAFGCGRLTGEGWGTCLSRGRASTKTTRVGTYVGTYQPYMYLLPGLAIRATDEPIRALRLGRLANALTCMALLLAAAALLWDPARGGLALAGLAVALTPEVMFLSTVINPNGPEIAGAICFVAALIRLSRGPRAPAWVWVACAAGGAVLAMTRSLGPFFVGALLLTSAAVAGPRESLRLLRSSRRGALLAAGAIALAAAAGLVWELRYQPHVATGPAAIVKGIGPSLDALPKLPKEAVGVFGAFDVYAPLSACILWWAMFAALLGGAAVAGGRRAAWTLLALVGAAVAVTLIVSAVYRQTGFELQTRYVLPYLVVVPLWAGELLSRRPPEFGRALLGGLFAAGALAHALAWYANAKVVGAGPDAGWRFVGHADWVPPLGWWAWIAVAAGGCLAYALAGLIAARAEPVAGRF